MLRLPLLLLLISTPVVLLLQIPATAMLRPAAAPSDLPASPSAAKCGERGHQRMGPPADAAQEAADAAPEDPKGQPAAEKQELRDDRQSRG